jgi:putative thiamine transport system ATP-binding protein
MLELQQVTIVYAGREMFAPVSCTVAPGSVLTLMGPSGVGKSSLMAAIAGDLQPPLEVRGDMILSGQRLNDVPIEQRGVGLLLQDDLLFPHLSVGQNLAFAMPKTYRREVRQQRLEHFLAESGLAGFAGRDIATLSGGQRARVSVLRTLLSEPRVVLLDEPFSRLDQSLRTRFRDWVFATLQKYEVPVLLVTHDEQDCLNGQIIALEVSDA